MAKTPQVLRKIEQLRQQLNKGFGSSYDPVRLQTLAPISQELDRLTVELARQELNNHRMEVKR